MKNLGWRAALIAGILILSIGWIIPWSAEKRAKGKLNINLGLDLQGGSHLVLEVVTADALTGEADTVAGRLAQKLKDKAVAVSSVHREGNTSVVIAGVPGDKSADVDAVINESTSISASRAPIRPSPTLAGRARSCASRSPTVKATTSRNRK